MTPLAYTTVTNNSLIIPHLTSLEEEALVRRYRRRQQPELVYEFTRDPGLLHQYYRIRADEYKAVYGFNNYPSTETKYDRNGHVIVARVGNFCVGGARIDIKTPRRPRLLPMEIEDFRLENHFTELRYKQVSYGQASGFALLPEFRGGDVSREIVKRGCSKAAALNLSVLFAVCPILNSRLYKQDCKAIGLKDTKIHFDIELPVYPHLKEAKHYLLSIPIDKSLVKDPTDFALGKRNPQMAEA